MICASPDRGQQPNRWRIARNRTIYVDGDCGCGRRSAAAQRDDPLETITEERDSGVDRSHLAIRDRGTELVIPERIADRRPRMRADIQIWLVDQIGARRRPVVDRIERDPDIEVLGP